MDDIKTESEHRNPVIKALVASYKRLISIPEQVENRNKHRVFSGTNSRIRKSDTSSARAADD